MLANPYVRGAVSGVGLVTILAGLKELTAAFAARRRTAPSSPGPTLPSDR